MPSADYQMDHQTVLFEKIWRNLQATLSREALVFPKRIVWLNGAPGAGKGTHTPLILSQYGIKPNPVVISDLLQGPHARKLMDTGALVGDEEVTMLLLQKLLDPVYREGVVVDGYPRTLVQAECIKYFYDILMSLSLQPHGNTPSVEYPKPDFHVLVLLVDEETSVKRQLHRGQKALENNSQVEKGLSSHMQEVRKTDLDPERAHKRYHVFCESTLLALQSLAELFPYHAIDANLSIEAVRAQIQQIMAPPLV